MRVETGQIQSPCRRHAHILLTAALLAASVLGGCATPDLAQYPAVRTDKNLGTPLGRASAAAPDQTVFESAWDLVQAGDFGRGEEAFRAWLARHGDVADPRTPKAMFWLGYCLEKQGKGRPARELYQSLIGRFPSSPAADQARQRLSPQTRP